MTELFMGIVIALMAVVIVLLFVLEKRFQSFEMSNEQKMENLRTTMREQLISVQQNNNEKLEEMRRTVDEKLEKTLGERMNQSFEQVSRRLEQVYRGLGEMQTLAEGVGDLKKVLSNVKTRGILGEIQLGAILEEILAPEQYDTNVACVPGSSRVVEYAVKMPGKDGEFVYLPIDSKFPSDAYLQLQEAYESGNKEMIDYAISALIQRIKMFAKDIHTKYIAPPYTTDFAIMFLPFEGLYAEVVNRGMVEVLQRDYKINITGPSTMAAMLNSLQMGFRTMAIQQRSSEVWKLLGAVKTEFDKFEGVLVSTQRRIDQANHELDQLVGVRTRQIMRRLSDVEKLSDDEAGRYIERDE